MVNAAAAPSLLTNVFPNKITGNFTDEGLLLWKWKVWWATKTQVLRPQQSSYIMKRRVVWHSAKSATGKCSVRALPRVCRTEIKNMFCKKQRKMITPHHVIQVIASAFGRSQWKKWEILCFWTFIQMSSFCYWFFVHRNHEIIHITVWEHNIWLVVSEEEPFPASFQRHTSWDVPFWSSVSFPFKQTTTYKSQQSALSTPW